MPVEEKASQNNTSLYTKADCDLKRQAFLHRRTFTDLVRLFARRHQTKASLPTRKAEFTDLVNSHHDGEKKQGMSETNPKRIPTANDGTHATIASQPIDGSIAIAGWLNR